MPSLASADKEGAGIDWDVDAKRINETTEKLIELLSKENAEANVGNLGKYFSLEPFTGASFEELGAGVIHRMKSGVTTS